MMIKVDKPIVLLALLCANTVVYSQAVSLNFKTDTVVGGDLVISSSGTDATDSFKGDRFEGQSSSVFEIQNITGIGTLQITAAATKPAVGYLHVTANGLQDGTSGYDDSDEGTRFTFGTAVRIQSIDWGSFTDNGGTDFDEVSLYNGLNGTDFIGTFKDGDTIGSTSFASTDPSTMDIVVGANHTFRILFNHKSSSSGFYLESMNFNVVPEPAEYALALGICSLIGSVLYRRRGRRVMTESVG
jgi:hypothetical protein